MYGSNDVIAKIITPHLASCDEAAEMFSWGDRWMREWRDDRPGIELRDSLGRRHRYGSNWEVWCCNLQFDCPAKAVISQRQTYLLMNDFLREATESL